MENKPLRKLRYLTRYQKRRCEIHSRNNLLTKHASKIQGWFRRNSHPCFIDPITQEKPDLPIFVHVEDDKIINRFNATTLFDYIYCTGDYRNPVTRKELNIVEVRRLQRQYRAKTRDPKKDIVDSMIEKKKQREKELQDQSLREFYSDRTSDYVKQALEVASALNTTVITKMVRITIEVIPDFEVFVYGLRLNVEDEDFVEQIYNDCKKQIEREIQSDFYYEEYVLNILVKHMNRFFFEEIPNEFVTFLNQQHSSEENTPAAQHVVRIVVNPHPSNPLPRSSSSST